MSDLSAYKITDRWPAERPDVLQLYSFPTPNGVKVTVLLEELLAAGHEGAEYDAHLIRIDEGAPSGAVNVKLSEVHSVVVPVHSTFARNCWKSPHPVVKTRALMFTAACELRLRNRALPPAR